LLNAEEGFSYTENMCRCRVLPNRHSKEPLIELGRAVKVGNLHGDMVHTDSTEAPRRRWSCERARGCQRASGQGSEENSELAADPLSLPPHRSISILSIVSIMRFSLFARIVTAMPDRFLDYFI
jgi:hypothetical protein